MLALTSPRTDVECADVYRFSTGRRESQCRLLFYMSFIPNRGLSTPISGEAPHGTCRRSSIGTNLKPFVCGSFLTTPLAVRGIQSN